MAGTKAYIGYDLGDGETITDIVVTDVDIQNQMVRTEFMDMPMPDSNVPGRALPTIFARDEAGRIIFYNSILVSSEETRDIRINFKRRPTDLIEGLDENTRLKLLRIFSDAKQWPDASVCPECSTEKMNELRYCVVTFTNAIFSEESYRQRIRGAVSGCKEIVFCVGHPTRWDDLDAAIYKTILQTSILGEGSYEGLPSTLVLSEESRAAFLYVRDQGKNDRLAKGSSALLIDVGSSTIDITAMSPESRNHQYNSGNNYLGARGIDLIIRDWYLDQLLKDRENLAVYQELVCANPTLDKTLTMFCRGAKEQIYSYKTGKANIFFGNFRPLRLDKETLDQMLCTVPVADVLRKNMDLPAAVAEQMGQKSWKDLFLDFMSEQRQAMRDEGIQVGRIILTGSASKMPVVSEVIKSVFTDLPESALFFDMDPSRTISKGLALVGPSNDKSVSFQLDVAHVLQEEVPEIVRRNLNSLASELSSWLGGEMEEMVFKHVKKWQAGDYATFNDMTLAIERACSPEQIESMMGDRMEQILLSWCGEVIGKDVAVSLKKICDKNGVTEFAIEDLNTAAVRDSLLVRSADIVMSPAIRKGLNKVVNKICNRVIIILIVVLCWVPVISWAMLFGGAGTMIWNAFKNNEEGSEAQLVTFVKDKEIPKPLRKLCQENVIKREIKKADIPGNYKEAFLEERSQEALTSDIVTSFSVQVQKKMDDIKYVIESR
ncbi:MAG: hypothetical protein LIO75_07760 [Lachnospiraceae bacterium]|nr:hypothetical protein [Lachnospiraceae bacterium]